MRTWRERRKEIKWRWRQKTRSMLATNTVVIHSRASHCLLSELLSLSLNFSLNLFFFSLTQRQVESKRKSFLWTSVYKRKKEVSFNLLSIKMMMMSIAWSCLLYTCIFWLLSCLVFSRVFVSLPSFRASWYTIKFVVPSFYSLSLSLFFLGDREGRKEPPAWGWKSAWRTWSGRERMRAKETQRSRQDRVCRGGKLCVKCSLFCQKLLSKFLSSPSSRVRR